MPSAIPFFAVQPSIFFAKVAACPERMSIALVATKVLRDASSRVLRNKIQIMYPMFICVFRGAIFLCHQMTTRQ